MHPDERLIAMYRHYAQNSQRCILSDEELYRHMAAESKNIVAESLGFTNYDAARNFLMPGTEVNERELGAKRLGMLVNRAMNER